MTAKCSGQLIPIEGNVVKRCVIFSIVSTGETVTEVMLSKCDTTPHVSHREHHD